jgi:hypothetical protein
MDVFCPRCQSRIVSEDMRLDTMVAKCRACHAVFDFGKHVHASAAGETNATPEPARPRRQAVPMPPGLRCESTEMAGIKPSANYRKMRSGARHAVVITRRWLRTAKLGLVPFAIFWNGFLFVWYTMLPSFGNSDGFMLLFYVFPLGHVAVGLKVGYEALTNLVNRTTVAVQGQTLKVEHGPIPARGNHRIHARDVVQLYAVNEKAGYELHVALTDGSSMPLLKDLPELNQALYIEQQIESALGLDDVRMPGEVEKE